MEMPALAPVESTGDGGSGGAAAGASLLTRSRVVEVAATDAAAAVIVDNPKVEKGCVMGPRSDVDGIGAAKSPVVRYIIRS
jgi:hypothetical protein